MLNRFQSFIQHNNLCSLTDRILLTVSGGIDSVVMTHLFKRLNFYTGIAHCNFNLRGEESDQDQLFVQKIANELSIPFFSASFNTTEYADNNNISIQMAARQLRYEWFEELREEQGFDFIATAHNKNDGIETFFINLIRGTGIRGLTGIPVKSENIIRPLLFLERDEIKDYADSANLKWRDDSSNSLTKYSRNKIRQFIIPLLKEMNPSIMQTMTDNMTRLKEMEDIYLYSLEKVKRDIIFRDKEITWIPLNEIKKLKPNLTWTFELLRNYDFSAPVISDIVKNFDANPGKQFYSSTHRLVKDRDKLIIHPLKDEKFKRYYIEDPSQEVNEPLKIELEIVSGFSFNEIPGSSNIAWLDLDLLEFPLMIRKWEAGDFFMPLGMNKMKKLSDFFIDNKISLPEKENTWLLISGNKIAWIIGKRIDQRFRIQQDTKRVLQCSLT